ncbi:Acid-sensing ion channel 4 [Araneus ventricosus]|uniref:Acid-sensing ion channel 4 n=1 Tax=Araneus ventricosus TaxID=182803 RepID=A0A4Y2M3H8_ARAVE|nr:Acid-sensing ion channel 4 [Araneus ventricosus]GBN21146.1 Acid-sensing ion channel 4 [Araneus ventricosus]
MQYTAANFMRPVYLKNRTSNSRKDKIKFSLLRSLCRYMKRFCNTSSKLLKTSSVYICARIGQSSFKIAWGLALILSLIVTLYRIQKCFHLYWQYPIVVSLEIDKLNSLEFPAVTVCNLNRRKINITIREGIAIIGTPLILSERRHLHYCQNGTIKSDKMNEKKLNLLMEYYGLDEEERRKAGIPASEFMKSCSFNGKYCSTFLLNNFTDFRYGNCITFNKQKLGRKPLRTTEIGAGSGLIFHLNLGYAFYEDIQNTFGAKLVVHHPEKAPSPEDDGLFVSPGFETSVSLKQTIDIRLPKPYRDHCMNYGLVANGFAKSKNECIRKCIQTKSYEKCGCIDQSLGVMNHLKQCDFRNALESCCLDEVLDSMSFHGTLCNCPLPCRSVYYNEKLSRALLIPKETEFRGMETKYGTVKLNVFYSSLERLTYEQQPKWEEPELLSYIGNELALWLGLSIIAVFEIFEKIAITL